MALLLGCSTTHTSCRVLGLLHFDLQRGVGSRLWGQSADRSMEVAVVREPEKGLAPLA